MYKPEYFRLLPVAFLLLTGLYSTFLQIMSLPTASVLSSGTSQRSLPPSEILARARAWTTANPVVPYNQAAEYQGYRTDCSGFVTMAWGLPANLPDGGLFTGNEPNNPNQPDSLSSVADLLGKAIDNNGKPILSTMAKLQPGDILLNQSLDQHVIIFAGWIDIAAKKVVNTATQDKIDGNYYYDGIEENGDVGAIEHTPEHPLNSSPFDYRQPWPYPYYPGHDSAGYYAWRFDPQKAANLGYAILVKPSGEWMPPSPQDGAITTNNMLHLAATAYPTQKSDPAIAIVYFTIQINGTWASLCSPNKPARSGSVYICDVDLKQFKFPLGKVQKLQISFDVVDKEGNSNLAPQGVHTLIYIPTNGKKPNFTPFVGIWYSHAAAIAIKSDGTATYSGRVFVWCTDDPRQPCDSITNDEITGGLNTKLLFISVNGKTAYGVIVGGTGDRDAYGNILPVGSPLSVTLNANDTLSVSDGSLRCGPQAIQNDVDPGCTSGA